MKGSQPAVVALRPNIDIFPQNFAIAQDSQARIYVGNSEGVLLFDGERWRLIPLPRNEIVRSLAAAGDRIYVGSYDLFGYLEPDNTGQPIFHDLSRLFTTQSQNATFSDIWDILVTPQGVFFKGLKHVFLWDPKSGRTDSWQHAGRFGAIVSYQDEILLQFRGEGLRVYREGGWQILPGTSSLQKLIVELLPLPDGGLLTLSRDGSYQRVGLDAVTPMSVNPLLPPSSTFSDGAALSDGTLVLCNDQGEIYLYDPVLDSVTKVKLESGYLSAVIASPDGQIFVVGDGVVYSLQWPSRWSFTGSDTGLAGSLVGARKDADSVYVLSSNGVYHKPDSVSQFTKLDWSDREIWDISFPAPGSAIVAEAAALKIIEGDRVSTLAGAELYPRVLLPSRYQPDRIYMGLDDGIAVLQKVGDVWSLLYRHTSMGDLQVNSLVELEDNRLLVGSERAGVLELTLSSGAPFVMQVRDFVDDPVLAYGKARDASVSRLVDDEVMVSTEDGFFRFSIGVQPFTRSDLDGLADLRPANSHLVLAASPQGDRWAYAYNRIFRQPVGGEWRREMVNAMKYGGINDLLLTASGQAIFVANEALMSFDASVGRVKSVMPQLLITEVESRLVSGQLERLPLAPQIPVTLGQDNWIAFKFALVDYQNPSMLRYQYRLSPVSSSFSDWTESSHVTYFALEPEHYELSVRAQDGHGQTSNMVTYSFDVAPAWYATTVARVLALFLLLALVYGLTLMAARIRLGRLKADNLRLEIMVQERTRDLESANRQLETMAHLDGLTEIPNRRRLDEYLTEVWRQCAVRNRVMAVLILDVDHFKAYNDVHGHVAGDELLKSLAVLLSHSLRRAEDLVARYGGEEFLVVLPGADASAALVVAESMRENVLVSPLQITVSIGVAVVLPTASHDLEVSLNELVEQADAALYQAKNSGRDQVRLYRLGESRLPLDDV
jgi:diguanylate cyclase (GGDEF)-like protein